MNLFFSGSVNNSGLCCLFRTATTDIVAKKLCFRHGDGDIGSKKRYDYFAPTPEGNGGTGGSETDIDWFIFWEFAFSYGYHQWQHTQIVLPSLYSAPDRRCELWV